jgi:hypothetical protein
MTKTSFLRDLAARRRIDLELLAFLTIGLLIVDGSVELKILATERGSVCVDLNQALAGLSTFNTSSMCYYRPDLLVLAAGIVFAFLFALVIRVPPEASRRKGAYFVLAGFANAGLAQVLLMFPSVTLTAGSIIVGVLGGLLVYVDQCHFLLPSLERLSKDAGKWTSADRMAACSFVREEVFFWFKVSTATVAATLLSLLASIVSVIWQTSFSTGGKLVDSVVFSFVALYAVIGLANWMVLPLFEMLQKVRSIALGLGQPQA